ncbi:MAG TPA: TIGR02466 family protein [Allosphingosinicella sp.]|jgi:uncharacterized protein (TIGR02466 family)|nr:TIGR02466 family protein [Allosphingosinicella sp.]
MSSDYHLDLAFSTPVILDRIEDAEAINAALEPLILARRREDKGISRSNTAGGWHSDTRLLHWAGDQVRPVVARMVELTDAHIVDTQARPGQRRGWILDAWANVNETGAGNAPHSHGACFWSAVYYVRIDEGEGGELVLDDPRMPMMEMHAPFLRFRDAGGDKAIRLRPTAGQIVIFPSWLVHSVTPWQGEGLRISIAVNLGAPPLQGGR